MWKDFDLRRDGGKKTEKNRREGWTASLLARRGKKAGSQGESKSRVPDFWLGDGVECLAN